MKNYYTGYYSGNISDEIIENTFYMDNFINFRLLLTATKALDNYEPKNVYFSLNNLNKETKILLTPWDLDLTFGMEWVENEEIIGPRKCYENVEIIEGINIGNHKNYINSLKSRWKYLRKNVFNDKVIDEIVSNYYDELTVTGAIDRENSKWEAVNLSMEIQEIRDWCNKRFVAVDEYMNKL